MAIVAITHHVSDIMSDIEKIKQFLIKCKNDIIFFAEHVCRAEDGSFYVLEEHQRAMVSSEEPQVIYFCGRRLGKSFMLAIEAIHKALFYPYQKVFVLSPTESQAKEIADTITGLIERSELIEREVKINNVLEKRFANGSRISVRTAGGRGNVSSIIGSGTHLLILDEIQDVSEELIYKILPVMRGQKGKSKLIMAGTPRDRSGFLFESLNTAPDIWDNGEWTHYPERPGTFTVYRKQTAYLDEEDNVIESGTPRITIDELKQDLQNMPLIQFKQEYCLDFMASVSDVYSEDLREKIFYTPENIQWGTKRPVCFGLDIGKMRNETVLIIAEVIHTPIQDNYSYKTLDVKWYKEFPLGTEYDEIEDYIAYELPKSFPNIIRGVIDTTGPGIPVFEAIEKRVIKAGKPFMVEPYKFSKEKKKDLVEGAVAALERGQARAVYHKRLNKEMSGYKRELTDSQNYIYHKTAGSDDYVDALNLCLYNITLGLITKVPAAIKPVPKTLKKQFGDKGKWQRKHISHQKPFRSKRMIRSPRRRL